MRPCMKNDTKLWDDNRANWYGPIMGTLKGSGNAKGCEYTAECMGC